MLSLAKAHASLHTKARARPKRMEKNTQGQVVHKREPNWALLVPILYAPLFPLMRIALKGNPRLPQYYAGALGAALTHAAYMMCKDSTV